MRNRNLLYVVLALSFVVLFPIRTAAWGTRGHQIIARVATDRLSSRARDSILKLLQGQSLEAVSTWADQIKTQRPDTTTWHYVDIALKHNDYQRARDCRKGVCIIEAIEQQRRVLENPKYSDSERAEALKFLVHFVGDVHQPLHSGHRDDRGGNLFQISLRGKGTNLHSVWDHYLLDSADLGHREWIARLEPLPSAIDTDAPQRWAEASCAHTNDAGFYPARPGRLPQGYLEHHRPLAEQRIRLAAARLAALLERALSAP